MANLPFYANESDCPPLVKFLADLGELGLLVRTGEDSWKAVQFSAECDVIGKDVCFWHIPSGPLPLVGGPKEDPLVIKDPWSGWKELRRNNSQDGILPWFGPSFNGVFHLNLFPRSPKEQQAIGRSDFTWGKSMGRIPVPKSTGVCWRKIASYLRTNGTPVSALGWSSENWTTAPDKAMGETDDYIALPGALAEMQAGVRWMPYPSTIIKGQTYNEMLREAQRNGVTVLPEMFRQSAG